MFELFKLAMDKDADALMNRQIGLGVNAFTDLSSEEFRTSYTSRAGFGARRSSSASVRKMVMPIGAATASMLRARPRCMKERPSRDRSRRTVVSVPSSVLNISLRITSSGLVSAAPATPAVPPRRRGLPRAPDSTASRSRGPVG